MAFNLQSLAQQLISGEKPEKDIFISPQKLAQELISKPISAREELNIPESMPLFPRIEPIQEETPDPDFGGLAPEFRDATPVRDTISNIAKQIIGIPEDSKVTLFPKPEEELEFGQTNVFAIPTNLEQTLEIFKPTLSLLGAGVTVPANVIEGLARDISGGSSMENLNAIRRILAGNPQEGDEIFVGHLLKGVGLTDESLKLPEGTIDRVGLIGDFIAFAKIDRLARFVGKVATSKNPTQTFIKEIGDVARIGREAIQPIKRVTDEALEFGGKFREEIGAIRIGGKPLVVASKGADNIIYYGNPGDLHSNLSARHAEHIRTKMNLKSGEPTFIESGFAIEGGKIINREEALKLTKVKSSIGKELDAADLREQDPIVRGAVAKTEAAFNKRIREKTKEIAENRQKLIVQRKLPFIAASAGTLALLGGSEAEAGVIQDTAKKIIGLPKKGIQKLDPLRLFPEKAVDKSKLGFRVKKLIKERTLNIDKAFLDSEAFVITFENNLSRLEREALPFIRQGIKNPDTLKKIGREDLIGIIKNPSSKLIEFNEKLGKYYDDAHKLLADNFDNVGFVDNYVTQIWDIPKARKSDVVNYFTTRNPFLKKRTIPSLEAGIKLGLKPKTLDVAELLRIYDQFKVKTIFNKQFAEGLRAMTDSETGLKVMLRIDKAPDDWVVIDHPALSRAMMTGRIGEEGIMVAKVPVKVNPEIASQVKAVFSKPFRSPVINALETINAFTKKSMLSFSFFHHFALTESAFSSGLGRKALSLWNPYKVMKALKNKDFEIFRRMPLAKDAIEHGVKFGSLPDFMVARVREGLLSVERATKNIPVVGRAAKLGRQANDLWDRFLWDYYHNTLKLFAYEKSVLPSLKRAEKVSQKQRGRSLNAEEINVVKNEIGTFVNDSFGGQQWELQRFFNDAKNRQMIHWLLLSPDWTFSVLKQAFAPIKGHRKAVAGGSIERRLAGTVLSKRAQLFWAKAIIYYNVVSQMANLVNTQRHTGQARFTWENPPGKKLDIFAGFNEDGSERYIRMGKQFREVMEWSYEPERKLGAKLSPILRTLIAQFAKSDPGSGFPTEFRDLEFFESLPERLKAVAKSVLPFSLRFLVESQSLQPFMASLPTSRGMTNAKTIRLYKQAIKDGNVARVVEVSVAALRNNLDADQLFRSANSFLKAEETRENKSRAKKILDVLNRFNIEDRKLMEQYYINQGIITPEIRKIWANMKKSRVRVKTQRQLIGIDR